MALELSVPDRSARIFVEVELRPEKLEKWLAALPLLNPLDTAIKLHDALSAHNRTPIEPALRFRLLELYRAPIQHLSVELRKHYLGLPLPLPERAKHVADRSIRFQVEMGYGYKQAVLDLSAPAAPLVESLDLARPLQRAVRHLTEVLFYSYLSYAPAPSGTWREIHALYALAEQLGVAAARVEDPLQAGGHATVADAYKHALLLDLCDPYHLPARAVLKIDEYLHAHAALAELGSARPRIEPQCQFLVDPASDRSGILEQEEPPGDGARYRLLHTVELARTIHLQLTQLSAGTAPAVRGLAADFFKEGAGDVLRGLIESWGINPKRVFRRTARPNLQIDVALGIDAINYWLNGGRRIVQSSLFIGPEPQRTRVGARDPKPAESEPLDYDVASWSLQDESAGGMSLFKLGLVRTRVRLGNLIATRFGGQEHWSIAVVRWVKSANSSRVEIGIQRLAPHAHPVLIKAISANNEETDFLPALVLPELPGLKQPETLVTPRNIYKPGRTIYIDDGCHLKRVVAQQLIELTPSFERFQFAPH